MTRQPDDLLLSIDCGTQSVRAILFDLRAMWWPSRKCGLTTTKFLNRAGSNTMSMASGKPRRSLPRSVANPRRTQACAARRVGDHTARHHHARGRARRSALPCHHLAGPAQCHPLAQDQRPLASGIPSGRRHRHHRILSARSRCQLAGWNSAPTYGKERISSCSCRAC